MNSETMMALCSILMCNDHPYQHNREDFNKLGEWADAHISLNSDCDGWLDFYLRDGELWVEE